MPKVDVVDLNNQKVGELELSDAVFGAEVNEALLYEAVRHHLAGPAQRHGEDEGPPRSGRLGQEAVEAEGHRPGPRGFDPVARSGGTAARRTGRVPRDYSYRLPQEDGAGRAALGADGEAADGELKVVPDVRRWPTTRRRRWRAR